MTQKFIKAPFVFAALLAFTGPSLPQVASGQESEAPKNPAASIEEAGAIMTGNWTECVFGGDGPIEIKDDAKTLEIKLSVGDPITGVVWEGDVPRENYEISYEAMREDGFDFFGALTFPIGEGYATLVPAGWGGGVFGLSSINNQDASENETTQYIPFESDQWYKFRVRVTKQQVIVWVDGQEKIQVNREGKTFSVRAEMDLCKPIGLAAFQSIANVRAVKLRHLTDSDLKANDSNSEVVKEPQSGQASQ